MKNVVRGLVVLGVSAGIVLLFVGGIISTVFPGSATDLVPYRVSASVKLLAVGGLICTLIVAGLRLEGIDRTLRLLILILGLVMLIIYTAGSSYLEWNIPSYMTGNQSAYQSRPTALGTPGFETVFALGALVLVVTVLAFRRRRG